MANSASLSRILEVTVEPRRSLSKFLDGTPGNSRGGAELARGGGFSWKMKENNYSYRQVSKYRKFEISISLHVLIFLRNFRA